MPLPASGALRDGLDGRSIAEYGHAIGGPNREGIEQLLVGPMAAVFSRSSATRPRRWRCSAPSAAMVAGHPNIFPNSWIDPTSQLSSRVPRSPNETEIWWYTLVPREMPPEHQAMAIGMANHVFGPAGFLEQEDGENWAQSTMQTRGYRARRCRSS